MHSSTFDQVQELPLARPSQNPQLGQGLYATRDLDVANFYAGSNKGIEGGYPMITSMRINDPQNELGYFDATAFGKNRVLQDQIPAGTDIIFQRKTEGTMDQVCLWTEKALNHVKVVGIRTAWHPETGDRL